MSEEHTIAIVSFEGAVKREGKRVREALKSATEAGILNNEFQFTISVSGRILDGEVKLVYSLAREYGYDKVEGDTTNSVVDEFLRRKGWDKLHKPLAISFNEQKTDDKIPF